MQSPASSLSKADSSRGQSRAATALRSPCGEGDHRSRQHERTPKGSRLEPATRRPWRQTPASKRSYPWRAAESSRIHSWRPSRCLSEPLSVDSPFISSAPASYASLAPSSCSRQASRGQSTWGHGTEAFCKSMQGRAALCGSAGRPPHVRAPAV